MNRQNFENKERFPLSTQALTFMQEMIFATGQLAKIGGDNYILSGCVKSGGNIAPGLLVVNGEVMPFEGGMENSTITVVETPVSVSANGLTFENARTTRKAVFSSGTGANYFPWANFQPLQTNEQLERAKATVRYVDDEIAKITAGSIPAGVVVMWSGPVSEVPAGWQLCDHTIIPGSDKRTPDLRGRFVVGYNNDREDYDEVGKTGGAETVALKQDEIAAHAHSFDDYFRFDDYDQSLITDKVASGSFVSNKSGTLRNDGMDSNTMYYKTHDTALAGGGGAHENRPPYYVLAFIIKL